MALGKLRVTLSVFQAVHVLETVQTVWQPVLAASVYKPAFEKLVNAVVTRLINEVLGFDDISVEEGEKVKLFWVINVRFDLRITLLRLSKKLLFFIHNVGFFFSLSES